MKTRNVYTGLPFARACTRTHVLRENSSLVHPPLEGPHEGLILCYHVNHRTPPRERVSIHATEQALGYGFEEIVRAEVGPVEGLADAPQGVRGGPRPHGVLARDVGRAVVVNACDDRLDKVWAKP